MLFVDYCKLIESSEDKVWVESIDELVEIIEGGEAIWSVLDGGLFCVRIYENVELMITDYQNEKTDYFWANTDNLMSTLSPFLKQEWFYVPGAGEIIKIRPLN